MARTIGLCALVFAVVVALPSCRASTSDPCPAPCVVPLVDTGEVNWKDDEGRLRMIALILHSHGETDGQLPMKDGALDVYVIPFNDEAVFLAGWFGSARTGLGPTPAEVLARLFVSARTGLGPTPTEVKDGDYGLFPYWRYKGAKPPPNTWTPILWDKKPRDIRGYGEGMRLVAFANGSVQTVGAAELNQLLKEAGQEHE